VEALAYLCAAELCEERLDDAIRHVTRALLVSRAGGRSHLLANLFGLRGGMHALLGNLREAAECFDDELDAAILIDSTGQQSNALARQCWLATWRGDLDLALRLGKEAYALVAGGDLVGTETPAGMLAQAHFYAGDPDTCVDLLLTAGGGPDLPAVGPVTRSGWYEALAAADAARGRTDEATAWADRAHAHSAGLPRRTGLAQLARVHALLPGAPAAAVPYARQAAESLTRARDRVNAGRAHLLAGTAMAAAGEVDRARAEFAAARALFQACGAQLFLDQVIREERRMNARRPRASRHAAATGTAVDPDRPAAALTPREYEVAGLVAQGLTNRQIAEKLFLSPKTVSIHLERIYRKLDVSRRAAVATILARIPGADPRARTPDQE
jgi:DNA-binding CsgD family transcriptional regulator